MTQPWIFLMLSWNKKDQRRSASYSLNDSGVSSGTLKALPEQEHAEGSEAHNNKTNPGITDGPY